MILEEFVRPFENFYLLFFPDILYAPFQNAQGNSKTEAREHPRPLSFHRSNPKANYNKIKSTKLRWRLLSARKMRLEAEEEEEARSPMGTRCVIFFDIINLRIILVKYVQL